MPQFSNDKLKLGHYQKFRAAWIKGFSIQTLFTLLRLRMHDLDLLRREKIWIVRWLNLK